MPGRVKHRNWHNPLLLIFGALVLVFVAVSIYVGVGSRSPSPPPSDLPFDLTK
jgi:hypothetical protein